MGCIGFGRLELVNQVVVLQTLPIALVVVKDVLQRQHMSNFEKGGKRVALIIERGISFTFPPNEPPRIAGKTIEANILLHPDYPGVCGAPFYIEHDGVYFVVEPTGWRIAEHDGTAVVPAFLSEE